jgi:hypothetical protein
MTNKYLPRIVLALLLAATSSMAHADARAVSSACASLEFMAKMLSVNTLLPASHDHPQQLANMHSAMAELNRLACQPVMLTEATRFSSRFINGQPVSADLYDSAWYFPNGQLFVARP